MMTATKTAGGVTRWVKHAPAPAAPTPSSPLLRHHLGTALRQLRLENRATLRTVASSARIALGYLSEIERGLKEPSSEVLDSLCGALGISLAQLLRMVAERLEPVPQDHLQAQVPDTIAQIIDQTPVLMHG